MANRMNAATREHRAVKRLAWLRDKPHVWKLLPSEKDDVSDEQSLLLRSIALLMKADGIYSRTSELNDVQWGIRLLVSKLRTEAQ